MEHPRAKDKSRIYRARLFFSWDRDREEKWLSGMAARGKMFEAARDGVYAFAPAEPGKLRFAAEYTGGEADDPAEIAEKCNQGWEYAGRFGKLRYYYAPAGQSEIPHPAAGGLAEAALLRTALTNLNTLLFLNIPGTFYCAAYILIFLSDGFRLSQIFSVAGGRLYFAGLVIGAAAYAFLISRNIRARRRLAIVEKSRAGHESGLKGEGTSIRK